MNPEEFAELNKKIKDLDLARKYLLSLQKGQERASQSRAKLKRTLSEISGKDLIASRKRGRPTLETTNPYLLETITNIAMYGSAVEAKRRTEIIRSVRSLDDLC